MKLIPSVKEQIKGEKVEIKGCTFNFESGCDERLINISKKVPQGETVVNVIVSGENGQGYKIKFDKDITIVGESSQGAFYGIQTLRQIIKNGYYDVKEINDSPDFDVRGFYFDITRGRIPTLETLKKLVDQLALCKNNMLQLYVEHVFPFKEYDGIYQKFGYMSAEETVELDKYCKENFVELVPSLSCFGHLYELLQSEKYKHLCEYENYEPQTIRWCERMGHHTIDVSNPESIELIKSLIDQYIPLFSSDKFNICCDETFDLCNGRNKGKDKAREYVNFVNKILAHVKSKGKKPMMWGDIISQHAELIGDLEDGVTFLSWGYSPNVNSDSIDKVKASGKPQYVCPGLNNWSSLIELTQRSIPNITRMAEFGYEAGAVGMLTTCWGDYCHISPLEACMYGLIYSCEKAWNVKSDCSDFDSRMDLLYFGYDGASALYKKLSEVNICNFWYDLCVHESNAMFGNDRMRAHTPDPDALNEAFEACEELIPYFMATKWENDQAREELLMIAQGTEYMIAMLVSMQCGEKCGIILSDIEAWLQDYSKIYLRESKMGELKEFIAFIYRIANKYIA